MRRHPLSASMTKSSLQRLRRPIRVGVPLAWAAGLVTALLGN